MIQNPFQLISTEFICKSYTFGNEYMNSTHKKQQIETAIKKKKKKKYNTEFMSNQFGIYNQKSSSPSAKTRDQQGNSEIILHETVTLITAVKVSQ